MGYWIPDNKGVYDDRSIILNRPRLKYWLGVGAEPTKGVQKLLWKIGFLPKKPPPFGTASLYPRPETPTVEVAPPPVQRDLGAASAFRDKVEQMDRDREERLKGYYDNAHRQFHERSSLPPDEEAKKFMETYYTYLEKLSELIPSDPQGKMETFIKTLALLDKDKEKVNEHTLMAELGITKGQAKAIIKTYRSTGTHLSHADIDDMKVDLSNRPKKILPTDQFVIPPEKFLTPLTDIDDEVRGEMPVKLFDIKHPIRPNKDYGMTFVPRTEPKQSTKKLKKHEPPTKDFSSRFKAN